MNLETILWFMAAIPSIILHEISHGYVALRCGDTTARDAGRLTLNPVSHIDPIGTILMPAILAFSHLPAIGYAKPVPVNMNRLRHPRNQSIYVSIAGPITNVLLSAVALGVCKILIVINNASTQNIFLFFEILGIVNLWFAFINLLPIPPLDGSVLIERLIPRKSLPAYFRLRAQMLPFALLILMGIMLLSAHTVILHIESIWLGLL